MRPTLCMRSIICLGICAGLFAIDSYVIQSAGASSTAMISQGHGVLYFGAACVFALLTIAAAKLPRIASLAGIATYLVVVVLMLALVGTRARDYNLRNGLTVGAPGYIMPLDLVTKMPMWHFWRLGLPIVAFASALVNANKLRNEEASDPSKYWTTVSHY